MRSDNLIELHAAMASMHQQLAKTSIAIYNMNEYIQLLTPIHPQPGVNIERKSNRVVGISDYVLCN